MIGNGGVSAHVDGCRIGGVRQPGRRHLYTSRGRSRTSCGSGSSRCCPWSSATTGIPGAGAWRNRKVLCGILFVFAGHDQEPARALPGRRAWQRSSWCSQMIWPRGSGWPGVAIGVVLAAGIDSWCARRAERKQMRLDLIRAGGDLAESLGALESLVSVVSDAAAMARTSRSIARTIGSCAVRRAPRLLHSAGGQPTAYMLPQVTQATSSPGDRADMSPAARPNTAAVVAGPAPRAAGRNWLPWHLAHSRPCTSGF
jgi:hypothetical protein